MSRRAACSAASRTATRSRWSARKRCLHVRQSTSGSVKPPTCPDASQTCGWRMIEESSATMSSRSCTIASSQRALARCPSAGRRSARSRRTSRARRRSPTTGRRSRAGGTARRSCPSSRRRYGHRSRDVSDSLRAMTPARNPVELHIVSDSTGETAARLVAGARGAVSGPAVRGGPPPARRVDRRPAARREPRQGPAGRDGLHARRPRAPRGDAHALPQRARSTTATCSAIRSSRSRRSRAWRRR